METKKYTENNDIVILWTPSKCIHSGVCVKMLPGVYHPRDKPWVTPLNASAMEIKEQIDQCPSGALGYILPGE